MNTEWTPLENVITSLKNTNERFKSLDKEMEILLKKRDAVTYWEKLRERARLIMDLPSELKDYIPLLDTETAETVSDRVECFSDAAKKALESDNEFGMEVLLSRMGCKDGDPNHLEKLINEIEKK